MWASVMVTPPDPPASLLSLTLVDLRAQHVGGLWALVWVLETARCDDRAPGQGPFAVL